MRNTLLLHGTLLLALLALPACTLTRPAADDASSGSVPKLKIPQEALQHYTGRYWYNAETGFKIESQGDRLFLQDFGGVPHELHFIGDGRYRCRETPITFTTVTERSQGWVHTAATLHFMLDDGSRRSHRRLSGDEITPREVLITEGYEQALPVYRELLDELPDDPHVSEDWLIEAGMDMAFADRHEPAIGLLRIASELYPESARTYACVGYIYRRMGWPLAALAWYEESLEVDPDLPTAIKAVAELQAEQTAGYLERTRRASSARHILTIRAWIDGSDLLKVRGDTMWLEHIDRALPGTWVTETDHTGNVPTLINGVEWIPEWRGRISSVYTAEDGFLPEHRDIWVAIRILSARGRVVIVERPCEDNDFTFTMMLDDGDHSGAAWYEVELDW